MFCEHCGVENHENACYCMECGSLVSSALGSGAPQNARMSAPRPPVGYQATDISPKSRLAVTLLAFFFGEFGIHRFYLGKIGTGILMLLTFGGLGIWAFIDFIMAVCGVMKDQDGKPIVDWEPNPTVRNL